MLTYIVRPILGQKDSFQNQRSGFCTLWFLIEKTVGLPNSGNPNRSLKFPYLSFKRREWCIITRLSLQSKDINHCQTTCYCWGQKRRGAGGAISPAALLCRCPGGEWYSNNLEYESNAGRKPGLSHPCINGAKLFSPPAGMWENKPQHKANNIKTVINFNREDMTVNPVPLIVRIKNIGLLSKSWRGWIYNWLQILANLRLLS